MHDPAEDEVQCGGNEHNPKDEQTDHHGATIDAMYIEERGDDDGEDEDEEHAEFEGLGQLAHFLEERGDDGECGDGENDPICEVGFDAGDNVVFVVDGQTKFVTDIENWVNNNFDELQKSLFYNDSKKYFLLEGTFSGEPVTDEKVI